MPGNIYTKERRDGARREKAPYQTIDFLAKATGLYESACPLEGNKRLTVEAWQPPDGRIVDATLISDEDIESREFMERIADALVKDASPDNLKMLEHSRCLETGRTGSKLCGE